jgi:hypothetical protein
MSSRWTTRLAWSTCALYVAAVLVARGLAFIGLGTWFWEDFSHAIVLLLFSSIGALVAARRPQNAVGWLLCAFAVEGGVEELVTEYGKYTLFAAPGVLPGGAVVAWLQSWSWAFSFAAMAFVLLLFPNGQLLSRRWRPLAWITAAASMFLALGMAVSPGPIKNRSVFESVPNPFALERLPAEFALALVGVSFVVLNLSLLAAAVSMIVRFRRARGVERQQLKWFAVAATLLAVAFIVNFAYQFVDGLHFLEQVTFFIGLSSVAVSVGIAILRHRLYDVDLLINRAVVYGVLSTGLALVYWASVLLLQQLLRPITQGSELAVIASTLAVAALFNPARLRIQYLVDRRFYRRKYDGKQILQDFNLKLRQEVDLDSLNAELVAVVSRAMQLEQASLWLKPEARPLSSTFAAEEG